MKKWRVIVYGVRISSTLFGRGLIFNWDYVFSRKPFGTPVNIRKVPDKCEVGLVQCSSETLDLTMSFVSTQG